MQTITTLADIKTWISNENPGNVIAEPALVEQLAETIRTADGRPAWGEDWQEWLDGNAERLVHELAALARQEKQRTDEQLRAQGLEPAQRFAAIGDDGTRPVVWGVGDSEEAALAEARSGLSDLWGSESPRVEASCAELRTVPVSEERYRRIVAGDVEAGDLW